MDVYRKMRSWSRMEGRPIEVLYLLVPILNIQHFFGYQVLDPDWSPRKHLLKLILATALIWYGIIGSITFMFSDGVKIDERSEAFAFILMFTQGFVKLVTTVQGSDNLRKLFEFEQIIFWPLIHEKDGLELIEIKKRLGKFVAIKYSLISLLLLSIFAFELPTVVRYINGDRSSLFACIYTFLPNTFIYYEIGWFLQTLFGLEVAFAQTCFDTVFTFNMSMGCLFVDLIIKKLQNMKDEKNPIAREMALKCICKYHVDFISFLKIVHRVYRVPATTQMLSTLGCVTACLLAMESSGVSSFGTLMLPAIGQVGFYCWYGQEIKSQGETLMTHLMMFDWVDLDASTRKSFILITLLMNKELRPGAMGSMDLSLATMKWVLQVSYQNFAVLRRFKQ